MGFGQAVRHVPFVHEGVSYLLLFSQNPYDNGICGIERQIYEVVDNRRTLRKERIHGDEWEMVRRAYRDQDDTEKIDSG